MIDGVPEVLARADGVLGEVVLRGLARVAVVDLAGAAGREREGHQPRSSSDQPGFPALARNDGGRTVGLCYAARSER